MSQQVKHVRPCAREGYGELRRNPVVILAWNSKGPNIAGMIRTAEAFLVEKVWMQRKPQSFCPAVSAQRWQPVQYAADLKTIMLGYGLQRRPLVALEMTDDSIPVWEVELPENMCLLVGNESDGLPPVALHCADMHVHIPQYGFTASLNVVTATSIALYEWVRQHRGKEASL